MIYTIYYTYIAHSDIENVIMYNPFLKESLAVRARARPVTFSYVSIARLDTFQPQISL